MIPTDENSGNGGDFLAGVVLPEGLHLSVFHRYAKANHVFLISHSLEIAAAEEEIDFSVVNLFVMLDGLVHIVEVSMHTPFNSNLHLSLFFVCLFQESSKFNAPEFRNSKETS